MEVGLTGIMGLAKRLRNTVQPNPMPTFLDMLKLQLAEPVFTADLRHNSPGRFTFGYIDEIIPIDNITWLESDPSSPYWDITLDLTSWNDGTATWREHKFTATVDTGTTMLFLPDVIASSYWFSVPGMRVDPLLSDAFSFPCSIANELPDLMFKLPGPEEHVVTIPGPYLNYGPVKGENGTCWGGLQSATGLDTTILGDIMLKAVYVAFDVKENKVGFANKVLLDEFP